MFNFLEKNLMGPMTKLSQLRLVRAITAAGMASIPFTIVGSLFLVLNVLPLTMPFLNSFFEATFFKVSDVYMLANKASIGIVALYFLLVISYEYTRIIDEEEDCDLSPINGMLLSLFAYMMFIPQFAKEGGFSLLHDPEAGIINGWGVGADGISRFGATGLFTAIIVSWLAVNIYKFCVKRKLIIKMPEEVPEGVSRSFTALIPAAIVAFAVFFINGGLVALGTDLFDIVAIPFGFVINIANSYIGLLIIFFLISSLWLVGIHGATIITSLLTPIVLSNMAANQAGANIPLAGEFYNAFVNLGGSGSTLGLILMCAVIAKSEQLKILGRAALVPGLFNINEPILFGLPIVYNPIMAIPFILAPMVSASIAYFSISLGIIKPLIAQQPWPTPAGIGAFIGTGGDWKAAVVAVICVIAAALVYYPFLKAYDKKLLKEQEENAAQ